MEEVHKGLEAANLNKALRTPGLKPHSVDQIRSCEMLDNYSLN
jgi:hypothetical protein